MKVSVKDAAPCEKLLSVTVSGDLIREEYEQFFKSVEKDARVPGFRPGRAPRQLIEARFKSEAKEKVLQKLIMRSFRDAIGEKKIEFLGRPIIRQVEFTEEKLTYEALLEIPPSIKLGKYRGLSAERPKVEVTSEEVDEAVERLRESLAKFVAVEDRSAQKGDYLIADYECTVDGRKVEKRVDDWFELKDDEFLKGFSAQLVGVKPGEEREVRITFPEKFAKKEWAGKEGVFRVKVKEVKTKQLLPLTDELAKETGEFETLQDLRNHFRARLEAEKTRQSEMEFENNLLEALLKENPFPIPKGGVERRMTGLLETTVQSLLKRGVTEDFIRKEIPSMKEKLRPQAEKEVRLSFLLTEIARQEKMEISPADFEAKYKEIATQHHQSEEAVRKYYEEHKEAKEWVGDQILREKVIRLIKENAKIGRPS